MKDAFSKIHPAILISYFLCQTVFIALCFHPVFLFIAFATGLLYIILTVGSKNALGLFLVSLANIVVFGLINPVLNRSGETVIFYVLSKPVTLQAVAYGGLSGLLFSDTFIWIYIMSKTVTTRQSVFLFGKAFPAITLIVFMSIRMIKRYRFRLSEIISGRKGLFPNEPQTSRTVSATGGLLTYALENGADTVNAMESRGYGVCKATNYYDFPLTKKNILLGCILGVCAVVVSYGISLGVCKMYFFPSFFTLAINPVYYVAYGVFCLYPILLFLWSELKWTLTK